MKEYKISDLNKMDLHDEVEIDDQLTVRRVPYGWIYHTHKMYPDKEHYEIVSSVFVPMKVKVDIKK